ncbi:branched-chain amino acid ABC transporter permease [Hwanghaeella grinnelliae]|uniref:Branched-chain amino acid ABC transporter permease n=1 Tax=Hwanghaeella grinnelliae TaxID=2500179 RepID=A0A437QX49_9PROT|nr:branched-chain amino acid ABC transporter permease [Hwanghaeella grinnelliae]RVU39094.1 branched-chain amino acid ABC transporter permease [Hwanghaeella grinnelliae]
MDASLVITQLLNGMQLGVLLFLVCAGLTLVFGIMDFINLAHGSFYMIGAYMCGTVTMITDSFLIGVLLGIPLTLAVGYLTELTVVRRLYQRDHLDHVLATFGLILIFDTGVHLIWGAGGMAIPLPQWLDSQIRPAEDIVIPTYRVAIIVVGLAVAGGLYYVVTKTRVGMLIRAGASNRTMVEALGVDIKKLFTLVFAAGAAIAGVAGMMISPITEASIGMGNEIIIVAFVVIIIGGIGSIKGAFVGALIVGLIDTLGRSYLDQFLKLFMGAENAETAAPAISAMLVYILMAIVLAVRPQGLFPPKVR